MTKNNLLAIACAVMACTAGPAAAAPDVGVSIGINQPGVYGRINIGNQPPPVLVMQQPVIIRPGPVAVQREPIYLYVPPAHRTQWSRYCGNYAACGQPVYFVQERWVEERWEREHHGKGHGRGHDRDRGRDDRHHDRDGDRDHDRGRHGGR
jgi:hypothetical protein